MRAHCLAQINEAAQFSGRVDTPDVALATFERARPDLLEAISHLGEAETYALFVEAVEREIDGVCRFLLTDPFLGGFNARIEC